MWSNVVGRGEERRNLYIDWKLCAYYDYIFSVTRTSLRNASALPCSLEDGETSFQLETTYKLQTEINYTLISNGRVNEAMKLPFNIGIWLNLSYKIFLVSTVWKNSLQKTHNFPKKPQIILFLSMYSAEWIIFQIFKILHNINREK